METSLLSMPKNNAVSIRDMATMDELTAESGLRLCGEVCFKTSWFHDAPTQDMVSHFSELHRSLRIFSRFLQSQSNSRREGVITADAFVKAMARRINTPVKESERLFTVLAGSKGHITLREFIRVLRAGMLGLPLEQRRLIDRSGSTDGFGLQRAANFAKEHAVDDSSLAAFFAKRYKLDVSSGMYLVDQMGNRARKTTDDIVRSMLSGFLPSQNDDAAVEILRDAVMIFRQRYDVVRTFTCTVENFVKAITADVSISQEDATFIAATLVARSNSGFATTGRDDGGPVVLLELDTSPLDDDGMEEAFEEEDQDEGGAVAQDVESAAEDGESADEGVASAADVGADEEGEKSNENDDATGET
jgi:hypothetical protein